MSVLGSRASFRNVISTFIVGDCKCQLNEQRCSAENIASDFLKAWAVHFVQAFSEIDTHLTYCLLTIASTSLLLFNSTLIAGLAMCRGWRVSKMCLPGLRNLEPGVYSCYLDSIT